MTILKYSNLAVRFLLELCALVALGYWGFNTGLGVVYNFVLGLGTPLAAAAVWGTYVAPKARKRLPDPKRLILELLIFSAATAALAAAGRPILAAAFGIAVIVSVSLMFPWKQRTIA